MKDYFCTVLVVKNTEEFRIEKPSIVTIGTFDGVHVGHQKIIQKLKEIKQSTGLHTVVLTFDPHPRKVLFPEQKDLKLITGIDERLFLFDKYGIDVCVVFPFSLTTANMDVDVYIKEILCKKMNTKYLAIGHDHRFGKNRQGSIENLKAVSQKYDFSISEISAEDIDSIAVSSTRIRRLIEKSDMEEAAKLLGHPFFMQTRVKEGKKLGKTLGYPTANLVWDEREKLIPPQGVYFVRISYKEETYYGMLNIGKNPTTDSDENLKIEVNIFNFDKDIYSEELRVYFLKYIREEKKFASLDMLVEQLHKDKQQCLNWMNELHV